MLSNVEHVNLCVTCHNLYNLTIKIKRRINKRYENFLEWYEFCYVDDLYPLYLSYNRTAGGLWSGYIITQEVYFACLDGLPMIIALITFNIFHPGRYVTSTNQANIVHAATELK